MISVCQASMLSGYRQGGQSSLVSVVECVWQSGIGEVPYVAGVWKVPGFYTNNRTF